MVEAARALSREMRCTPASWLARNSFALAWIHAVVSLDAGPPLGGLYLNPPDSGGLCDGVTTMPSARPFLRPWLYVRMAWETAGVGVYSSFAASISSTW